MTAHYPFDRLEDASGKENCIVNTDETVSGIGSGSGSGNEVESGCVEKELVTEIEIEIEMWIEEWNSWKSEHEQ